MPYPYGTQGAPAVGNGLGGLPRRTVASAAATAAADSPLILSEGQTIFGNGLFQEFYSNGTFVVPSGITSIRVRVVGAGGAGAQSGPWYNGGGGGGYAIGVFAVSPADSFSVTVGQGAFATAGGTSSFGALISATGGTYRDGSLNLYTAGGTGTGGDFQASGGRGGKSSSSSVGSGGGGAAGSYWGNGGYGGDGYASSPSTGGGGGGIGGKNGKNGSVKYSYQSISPSDTCAGGQFIDNFMYFAPSPARFAFDCFQGRLITYPITGTPPANVPGNGGYGGGTTGDTSNGFPAQEGGIGAGGGGGNTSYFGRYGGLGGGGGGAGTDNAGGNGFVCVEW